MKLLYVLVSITIFSFGVNIFTVNAEKASINCTINSILRVGSRGSEVSCLQSYLDIVVDGAFGSATQTAVRSFQTSHNLAVDGILGPKSKSYLVKTQNNYPLGCTSYSGYSVITGFKCDSSLKSSTNAPISAIKLASKVESNLVGLDKFIDIVSNTARRNGLSEDEVKVIVDALINDVTTTSFDYNSEFKKLIINEGAVALGVSNPKISIFHKAISKTLSFLGIKPNIAIADSTIPFGGKLVFSYFCAYSASWMLTITPLPPSYAAVLSYIPGTQGFAKFNLPFTENILGKYTPPGTCVIPAGPYPLTIPTEGTITPVVGSSLI
jgi:hypothetical protein